MGSRREVVMVRLFRVMTFDGGGIRGVLSARLIQRLEYASPGLSRSAAMYAGTSTGSIIALGLAYGLDPKEIVDLYVQNAEIIFTPKGTSRLKPRYGNARLTQVLEAVFPPTLRLSDLRRAVLVPTFSVRGENGGGWRPVFLTNLRGSSNADTPVVDAILASSAAPGFFPSYGRYIDGGTVDSNPSISAIAYAARTAEAPGDLSQIRLLSTGTGHRLQGIRDDTSEWGEVQWFLYPKPKFPFPSALMSAQTQASSMYSRQLLGRGYYRLNPLLKQSIPLDAWQEVPKLLEIADAFPLGPAEEWVREAWYGESLAR